MMQGATRQVFLAVAEQSELAKDILARCSGIAQTQLHYALHCLEDIGWIQKEDTKPTRPDGKKQWPGYVWSLTEAGKKIADEIGAQ